MVRHAAIGAPPPFFERQRGGLCRMHAINAYLGRPAYTEATFKKEIDMFDAQQRARFGATMSAADFDAVFADQRSLVTYILGKHGIYARHVELGAAARHIDAAIASGSFFVYNMNHIWIVSRHDGRWVCIDSQSGVTPADPTMVAKDRSVGLLIPIADLLAEFATLDLSETGIGAAVALLEVQLGGRRADFPVVANIIDDYYAGADVTRRIYALRLSSRSLSSSPQLR